MIVGFGLLKVGSVHASADTRVYRTDDAIYLKVITGLDADDFSGLEGTGGTRVGKNVACDSSSCTVVIQKKTGACRSVTRAVRLPEVDDMPADARISKGNGSITLELIAHPNCADLKVKETKIAAGRHKGEDEKVGEHLKCDCSPSGASCTLKINAESGACED